MSPGTSHDAASNVTLLPSIPAVLRIQPTVPREVVALVTGLLIEYSVLVPRWVDEIVLKWKAKDHDSYALITVQTDYRRLKLTIGSGFLDADDEERRETIMHEFAHAATGPLYKVLDETVTLLKHYIDDEHVTGYLVERARVGDEQTASDLTRIYARLLSSQRS